MKYTYHVSIPCPLGGPDIFFTGECEAQFRDSHSGYDFDGYMPLTIYRDNCELTHHGMSAKDWEVFKARLRSEIQESNTRPLVSKIIDAACKGTAAPVIITFDLGSESGDRSVEIEALSVEG